MIAQRLEKVIVHGSPSGYEMGCRSQGGCDNHGSSLFMTCVDAAAAARDDWSLRDHPHDVAIPAKKRHLSVVPSSPPPTPSPAAAPSQVRSKQPLKHGSVWGYARGCKTIEGCPNTALGKPSCVEERRRYYREYAADRASRAIEQADHGTKSGYVHGCHDRATCPGHPDTGETCSDAARLADTERRRQRGVAARPPLVSSTPVREHLARLQDSGMTIRAIAERSNVSPTGIRNLINGRSDYVDGKPGRRHREIPQHITADKAEKILAVTPDESRSV